MLGVGIMLNASTGLTGLSNRQLFSAWLRPLRAAGGAALLAISLASPALAEDKVVKLTSLDWPPYTSADLPEQGASALVAKKAFEAMGYKLVVEFYPWKRAVNLAENDAAYAGYFPEYYSKENEASFIFSDPMGDSPLGFAERASAPVKWETLNDLKDVRIGVVSGYVNTADFDAAVASGELTGDAASSDDKNIQKLAADRIGLAVIDQNVMDYLLRNQFPDKVGAIQFNAKPLEVKKLYICFSKNAQGEKLAAIFNEGLKKIDANQLVKDYLAGLK